MIKLVLQARAEEKCIIEGSLYFFLPSVVYTYDKQYIYIF